MFTLKSLKCFRLEPAEAWGVWKIVDGLVRIPVVHLCHISSSGFELL